mmetsp:Transcript_19232/g.19366  ORF Transcript_19232/g.19366 Transcript_19232/m.19366 type:complete len:478 (+) Transcript_19232:83-1516(+)
MLLHLIAAVFLACVFSYVECSKITNLDQLKLDENEHLAFHSLLFSSGSCAVEFRTAYVSFEHTSLMEIMEMSDEVANTLYGDELSRCAAVCLERGVPKNYLRYPLPTRIFDGSTSPKDFIQSCRTLEMGIVSYFPKTLFLYWVPTHGNGKLRKTTNLKPGERNTFWSQTQLGHKFKVVDPETEKTLVELTAEFSGFHPIGDAGSKVNPKYNPERMIKHSLNSEWDRSRQVRRTFTEWGFQKGHLPNDVWGSIQAYYYNNRNNHVREEWETKGHAVNWWDKDAKMIGMPWGLKGYWQTRIQELANRWIGGLVNLENTSIYGIRRYEDGARLLAHVDRQSTHAVSCIINVAQGGLRKPWMLEIYDHADRLHEIEMQPGEIVYYESARCLHGRMAPLDGGFYVNLFSHYRPLGDPDWYTKSNPPGTPEPVIDITGMDVPTLSPSRYVAYSASDLFNHWKTTGSLSKSSSSGDSSDAKSEL